MKTAFELAMERLGGKAKSYTEEQKKQLADVDSLYESRIVQARFDAEARTKKANGDPEKLAQIQKDLATEIKSLEERRESKKEELRKQFQ
ncbi:MAG TPA: hypothetical protein PLE92_09230 [Lentisphaeria bacterium]|nr:MAG: hypothetical protein BWX73_01247 [Lentisphaerae bacterium ADurb.Bin082]HQC53300.1 hypothetical protein [Lentisphaeria bacterium]